MQMRRVVSVFAIAPLMLLALSGCGGGGGGTSGGDTSTVGISVSGAQWVAFQDGKEGTWRTLSTSGGVSQNVPLTAPDGRYSVAWVCPGDKPIVNVVHATRSEMPDLNITCPSAPSATTVNVTVEVRGLSGGDKSLTQIGEHLFLGSGRTQQVVKGTHDVIATRFTATNVPNRIWVHRNVSFDTDRTYTVNFDQADGALIRVVDVSSGTLTVSGIDTGANEQVLARFELVSANRISLITASPIFPLTYPIIPSNILNPGERFRVRIEGIRGEERVFSQLPDSLSIELPPPFNPDFSLNSSGPVAVNAIGLSYAKSPVRGYQMTIGGDGQTARWNILISIGWLGSDTSYTSPSIIQTLEGWNSNWSIRRGIPVLASMTVFVSSNSPREVLYSRLGLSVPSEYTISFATRSLTVTR